MRNLLTAQAWMSLGGAFAFFAFIQTLIAINWRRRTVLRDQLMKARYGDGSADIKRPLIYTLILWLIVAIPLILWSTQ